MVMSSSTYIQNFGQESYDRQVFTNSMVGEIGWRATNELLGTNTISGNQSISATSSDFPGSVVFGLTPKGNWEIAKVTLPDGSVTEYKGEWIEGLCLFAEDQMVIQSGEEEWNRLDKTELAIESYALTNSMKKELFKYAAKYDKSVNDLKYVKGVKVVGKVLVVAGVVVTGYEIYDDLFNEGDYYSGGTRSIVLGIGLVAPAIPYVGWFVAGGIGLADALWGDQFYDWVELQLGK
jgi:hypothetical protein